MHQLLRIFSGSSSGSYIPAFQIMAAAGVVSAALLLITYAKILRDDFGVDAIGLPLEQRDYASVEAMADAAFAWKGRIEPGMQAEYKRRHDGLIAARGDAVSQGPDSNFTIWCGAGYIFGYCEKVKAFDREMTEAERASTVAWETRQLEIMDWLTDDVDWITGEKHRKIRRMV